MKVNLSQNAVEAISNIQENPVLIGIIEDAENFILDYVDCNIGDESLSSTLSKGIVNHVKGLRAVRKLLENIVNEGGAL